MFNWLKNLWNRIFNHKEISVYVITEEGERMLNYCVDKLNGETYHIVEFDEELQKHSETYNQSLEDTLKQFVLFKKMLDEQGYIDLDDDLD